MATTTTDRPDTLTGLRTVDHGSSVLHPGTHRYGVQLPDGTWTWAWADPTTGQVHSWAQVPPANYLINR